VTQLRTPLSRVLGRGPAHEGVTHWWIQRLTAIALIPLSTWFAWSVLRFDTLEYTAVHAWLNSSLNALGAALLVLVLTWHSSLGVQVVVEDYVHHDGARFVAVLINKFGHALLAAAGVFAVLKVAFGAGA
jgi:succinate dehydrogenase / fumarate reductase membrane anchor subunit